jgi:hypothetical protein
MSSESRRRAKTNRLRVAILTSLETRHRFFANQIRRRFDVGAIVYARPTYNPATVNDSDLSPREQAIVADHFAERSRLERNFFGHDAEPAKPSAECTVLNLDAGLLNQSSTVECLHTRSVNCLVVFGTDLIKPPLLAPQKWIMVNMHLGLSPYYRGTATNFYPLLNQEPQYVGATIHRLDAGIDSGPILRHARPAIEAGDCPHSIGCKAIASGIAAMIEVLKEMEGGADMAGVPQWHEPNSRVYFRRDYHPRQVVELYDKWNNGLLENYLTRKPPAPRLVNCVVAN